MKTLVFSDTHLGKVFDENKFYFLQKIIQKADTVIIAGDFWEGLQITFNDFVSSPWKALFPLLKKKNTIYVFGNHDFKELTDQRVSLFSSKQTDQYTFQSGRKTFVVEHGHRFPLIFVTITRHISKNITRFTHKNLIIGHQMESVCITLFGKKFKESVGKLANKSIKKRLGKEFNDQKIFICGHTHSQEIDLKEHFVNTGMIRLGIGQYIIIENGEITPRDEKY